LVGKGVDLGPRTLLASDPWPSHPALRSGGSGQHQPPGPLLRGAEVRRHDPSTGERIVLVESVAIQGEGDRAERAAYREAEKLLADADALEVARTEATVGALLERWMDQHEIDPTTRMTYEAQRAAITGHSALRERQRRPGPRRCGPPRSQ
jgi:hypothetical protein